MDKVLHSLVLILALVAALVIGAWVALFKHIFRSK